MCRFYSSRPRPPPHRREGQWTIRTIQPHYRVILIFKGPKLRNNEVIDGVKTGSAWTLLYYLNICNSVAITAEKTHRKMQYGKIFKSNKSEWKNKVTVLRQSFKSHLSKFNYSYHKKESDLLAVLWKIFSRRAQSSYSDVWNTNLHWDLSTGTHADYEHWVWLPVYSDPRPVSTNS